MAKMLSSGEPVKGIVRYAGDKYFSAAPNALGNPWFVTSFWPLQFRISRAENREDLEGIAAEIARLARFALPSGIFSEQIDPHTGGQLSIAPLVWSHAEFVTTVIMYLERLEKLGLGTVLYAEE